MAAQLSVGSGMMTDTVLPDSGGEPDLTLRNNVGRISSMRLVQYLTAAILLVAVAAPAGANEYADAIKKHAETVKSWLSDDTIQSTLQASNDKNAGLIRRSMLVLDKKWKKELKKDSKPIISEVMGNDLSAYLKKKKEQSQGLYAEIIVMDERGISAGMSDLTEDYWYGQKDIWKMTYRKGPTAILIGEVEKDESSQKLQSRLSLPVPHTSGKYNVGAITIRLNVEMLAK